MATRKAEIIKAPEPGRGFYLATIKNTRISQRDTLELVIVNLATALGIKTIYKADTAAGSVIYEPQGCDRGYFFSYQSATNTILDLSRHVAEAASRPDSARPR